MQIKTISKIIKTKLNSWLNSITDEELKKELKDNILVSGGSITSLFLNEPVNDYDIYVKTTDLAEKIAKYYSKNYPEIKVFRGDHKEKYYQDTELHKEINPFSSGVTGSFFRNLKPDQVKLWFNKEIGYKTEHKDVGLEKYIPLYFSPNAISLSDKVQIVLRFTGNNEQIHKTFDFVHATNYFTFEEGLVTNKKALESILTKQLLYQGSFYPLTSIIRTKKFIKRHWNINAGEYLKIMFQISNLNLTNVDVLEDQLVGVDVAYFQLLINILRKKVEKEPNWVPTYEYIFTIIDKVFQETENELE